MWKSKFRRRAPSTRCCPRNYICPISTPSTRCCPQNSVCSMARVEVHAGLAAIEYPNSLVDVHAATDAWSRVCWPLGMTTILPVTRVTGRASSRPAIVRSRSGLRERRGELRGRPRGDEEHFKRGGLRAAGCPKEERLLCLLRDGAAQRRRGGAAPRVRCARVRADARAAFFAFLTRRRARPVPRQSNLCPAQSNLKSCRDRT